MGIRDRVVAWFDQFFGGFDGFVVNCGVHGMRDTPKIFAMYATGRNLNITLKVEVGFGGLTYFLILYKAGEREELVLYDVCHGNLVVDGARIDQLFERTVGKIVGEFIGEYADYVPDVGFSGFGGSWTVEDVNGVRQVVAKPAFLRSVYVAGTVLVCQNRVFGFDPSGCAYVGAPSDDVMFGCVGYGSNFSQSNDSKMRSDEYWFVTDGVRYCRVMHPFPCSGFRGADGVMVEPDAKDYLVLVSDKHLLTKFDQELVHGAIELCVYGDGVTLP